ncbi:unnamed protein product [Paramecium octaurelia]|uniref:Insertion element IS150 protein InsJ-like helix-turn-helix domain-containing protein n=1 Tax=Paramecium octaurelia TaxID=43137 RepID=A0A8S1S6W7_PAROT|nr:unnamed protein product [Paramecium octaurelia]
MIHSDESSGDHFSPNSQHNNNANSGLKDNGKKYAVIDHQIRVQLLKRILSKEATIKEAAKEFGVNFSTAKAILQTYRKEGRIGKKKTRDRNKKKKDDSDYHFTYTRKVQSMYDLEREAPQHRRTFSPDLRPADRSINQHPLIVQQQLNFLNSQSQVGSTPNLDEPNAQMALAICQRELAQQKMINMQLLMMLQTYQNQGQQLKIDQVKVESDKQN